MAILLNCGLRNRPVTYTERTGSPQYSFSGNVFKVRRVLDVAWVDLTDFLIGLLGYSERVFSQSQLPCISRKPPHAFQGFLCNTRNLLFAGQPWLYASQIESVEALGAPCKDPTTDTATYTVARVTVLYESPFYRIRTDSEMKDVLGYVNEVGFPDDSFPWFQDLTTSRYIQKNVQPTAEFLTLPVGAYRFVETDTTIVPSRATTGQARIIGSTEITYTFFQVPGSVPAADKFLGCVNDDVLDGYPTGTLLLTAVDRKPYRQITGDIVFDYTYRMKYKNEGAGYPGNGDSAGHNHYLRPVQKNTDYKYWKVTTTGRDEPNGKPIYPSKPFRWLFRLDDPSTRNILVAG